MKPIEEWRDVFGYEGFYSVSSYGRVRRDGAATGAMPGRILKGMSRRGWLFVCLSKNNKNKTVSIHRIVARAFIGELPEGKQVNHIDGNKRNNHFSNLEYVTQRENKDHAVRMGFYWRGSKNLSSVLREKDVALIKKLIKFGLSHKKTAKIFDVDRSTIGHIVSGRNWAWMRG